MGKIPIKLTPEQFEEHADSCLSKAKRGFVSKIPRHKLLNYILYVLHTGCQWHMVPIDKLPSGEPEISWQAVCHHFRKWSGDGSFERLWHNAVDSISEVLDLSEINIDGTHTVAKKGGKSAAWQGRKRAKTTNIIPVTDRNGHPVASTGIIPGNHHDAFELGENLRDLLGDMGRRDLPVAGAHLNADSAFDTKAARKICFNKGVIPNVAENRRNRKSPKKGRKRIFDGEIYGNRFVIERTFAWVDKFRRLLIRFERKDEHFHGFHCVAFAMTCLRNLLG
jgi:transposase